MQSPFDLQFSPTAHLRLLLRLDRGFNVQRAVADAVKKGDRVLVERFQIVNMLYEDVQ